VIVFSASAAGVSVVLAISEGFVGISAQRTKLTLIASSMSNSLRYLLIFVSDA